MSGKPRSLGAMLVSQSEARVGQKSTLSAISRRPRPPLFWRWWLYLSPESKRLLVVTLPLVALIATGFLRTALTRQQEQTSALRAHAAETRNVAQELLTLLLDVETRTQAFVLNGLSKDLSQWMLWAIFALVALLTYFWTKKQTDQPRKPMATLQCGIAVLSFTVWAFALPSGPFTALGYPATVGSIILILYTLGIGLVVPDAG